MTSKGSPLKLNPLDMPNLKQRNSFDQSSKFGLSQSVLVSSQDSKKKNSHKDEKDFQLGTKLSMIEDTQTVNEDELTENVNSNEDNMFDGYLEKLP